MKKKKLLTLMGSVCVILMLVALPFMGACAPEKVTPPPPEEEEAPPPEEEAPPPEELTIGLPSLYSQTFHPFQSFSHIKVYITPLFDWLVGLDQEGNVQPGIAYKWEESADHLSWTFWIREDVTFHDGTALTLGDVKFSLETILDEETVNGRSLFEPYLEQVEVVLPNKIVVHLKKSWNIFIYQLSKAGLNGGIILPKKYIQEKGVDYFNAHPVGTGPYRFLAKKEGDYIKYEALDHHWRVGTPRYKYLTFKNVPEEGTRVAALEKGELDIVTIALARADEIKEKGFPIVQKETSFDLHLFFLRAGPDNPLRKKEVREALVYAIDKREIAEYIFRGRAEVIGHNFAMTTGAIGYEPVPPSLYDPEKARQLLANAGYPDGFKFYHYVWSTVPEVQSLAETLASYWAKIGVETEILIVEPSTFKSIFMGKSEAAGPASTIWVCDCEPSAPWLPLFHSNHEKFPYSQFGDSTMDQLIEDFDSEVTLEGYEKATRKCEEYVRNQYWVSGFCCVPSLFATGKDIPSWNCGVGNKGGFRFEYIGEE